MKNTIQLEMLNWWSIYKPSGSGVADKQMSDDTFNEQEWEAVETTAIDHAVAQFEIPPIVDLARMICILFRSSTRGNTCQKEHC